MSNYENSDEKLMLFDTVNSCSKTNIVFYKKSINPKIASQEVAHSRYICSPVSGVYGQVLLAVFGT